MNKSNKDSKYRKIEQLVKRIEAGEVHLYTDFYVEWARIVGASLKGSNQ